MKQKIQSALKNLQNGDLYSSGVELLNTLGYASNKDARDIDIPISHYEIKEAVGLFQVTTEDISQGAFKFSDGLLDDKEVFSFLFVAIELKKRSYNRQILRDITKEINKAFKIPVIIIFRYGSFATLSIIDFRINKRDNTKDVLQKVTTIKDINLSKPHRAHIEILFELSLSELSKKQKLSHFAELHTAWQKTLDTKELNNRFYRELSNWYFWATGNVSFPNPDNDKNNNETNVIRMLTRLIFVWFIKEKGLVDEKLFSPSHIQNIIDLSSDESSYYKAVLQNLFFATLNAPIDQRGFADEGNFVQNKKHYGVKTLYRYAAFFKIPKDEILQLFLATPFLNGGLFECLDKEDDNGKVIYYDGFTRKKEQQPIVPNKLFFANEASVDLNSIYDTKGKKYTANGLLNILNAYKFTVEENTPLDTEIALDPELLGRVFENLLASYNPETGSTARKATGSYYTPREIVDYMVNSSLKEYLKTKGIEEAKLDKLLSYSSEEVALSTAEKTKIIDALDSLKIIDPAIGSGAFPMGLLHAMTHLLSKVDPQNELWKQKLFDATPAAFHDELKRTLECSNLDYTRKLHLIQNTIYGVDIQPVAVQIAKLRFFISLIIEQNPTTDASQNYGITALPNLETKFVVANSLLPLERKIEGLFDYEPADKEKEIIKNRERHFYVKSRAEKLKIIEEDKKLRKELEAILLKDGAISKESAVMLSNWNPYDPNHSAPFFDKEFMFGITDGFDIVIGNPPYIRQEKIKELKPILQKSGYSSYNGTADIYIYFFELGYKLLKDKGTLSFITSNKYTRAKYGKEFREFVLANTQILEYIDFNGVKVFESATVDTSILTFKKTKNSSDFLYCDIGESYKGGELKSYCDKHGFSYSQGDLSSESFTFANPKELKIKKRIEEIGTPLKEWDIKIYRGILTGFKEAFTIDTKTRDELIAKDPKSAEILKPMLRGRDIKRYGYEWAGLWLINSHNNPPVNIDDYPAIKEHLEQYYPELKKRSDQGITPYNLRNCAYLDEFEKEKIVYPDIGELCFAYDNKQIYFNNTVYFLNTGSKYILAVSNSKIVNYWYKQTSSTLGDGGSRGFKIFIELLPIPKIPESAQKPFEILADYIIYAKSNNLEIEAEFFESIIDVMVYGLYFKESMMAHECYINDEVAKILLPLEKTEEFIKNMKKSLDENVIIKRGVTFSSVVPEVKTVLESQK